MKVFRVEIAAAFSLVIALMWSSRPHSLARAAEQQSQPASIASSKTEEGLETVEFDTLNGIVVVNLPDDLATSDTISGTVISETKGETQEQIAGNQDELNGLVVEISGTEELKEAPSEKLVEEESEPAATTSKKSPTQKELASSPVKPSSDWDAIKEKHSSGSSVPVASAHKQGSIPDHPPNIANFPPPAKTYRPPCVPLRPGLIPAFTCLIPPTSQFLIVTLKDTSGKIVCQQPVRCKPKPKTSITSCEIPATGTCGRPLRIKGECDGRSATSKITVNNKPCKILAESPRQQVCRPPVDTPGRCKIVRCEGRSVTTSVITLKPAPPIVARTPQRSSYQTSPERQEAPPRPVASDKSLSGRWTATFATTSMTSTDSNGTRTLPPNAPYSMSVTLTENKNTLVLSRPSEIGEMIFSGSWNGTNADLKNSYTNPRGALKAFKLALTYNRASDTFTGEFEQREDVPAAAQSYSGLGSPSKKGGAVSSVNRGIVELKRD